MAFVLLVFLVAFSFAAPASGKVKSKRGDIELSKARGGSDMVCTAGFHDEMQLLQTEDSWALVKASCGQGWVPMGDVERVQAAAGDKSMQLDQVDVLGWIDNPSAVFVLDNNMNDFAGVNIDRDFKEYLQHTMDREQMEMKNNEN